MKLASEIIEMSDATARKLLRGLNDNLKYSESNRWDPPRPIEVKYIHFYSLKRWISIIIAIHRKQKIFYRIKSVCRAE